MSSSVYLLDLIKESESSVTREGNLLKHKQITKAIPPPKMNDSSFTSSHQMPKAPQYGIVNDCTHHLSPDSSWLDHVKVLC